MVRLASIISCAFAFGASGQNIHYDDGRQSRASYSQRGPQPLPQYQPQQSVQQPPPQHRPQQSVQQPPPQYRPQQSVQQPPPQNRPQQSVQKRVDADPRQQWYQQQQQQYLYQQRQASQQQPYQQPQHTANHQPHPQSYQQPQYTLQQAPHDDQYPQPMQAQEGNEEAMYPLARSQDNPFEPGMAVMARFAMDFGDVVVAQGTMGQIISQKGEPLLVKWEKIGDRPAAPSQLMPIVGPTTGDETDDEDVFFPHVKRIPEVPPTNQKMMIMEAVEEEPVISVGRMEENRAIEEARMAETKANDFEKSQGKGKKKGKGKKGKADVTV